MNLVLNYTVISDSGEREEESKEISSARIHDSRRAIKKACSWLFLTAETQAHAYDDSEAPGTATPASSRSHALSEENPDPPALLEFMNKK